MKDFFERYKKVTFLKNLSIVFASFIIALGVNFFVLDSNIGKSLTADVLGTSDETKKGDIYLESNNGKVLLKTSKNIKDIKSFSLSFYYNPENVSLENINSSLSKTSIANIANEEGLNTIIVNFDNQTVINKDTEILSLEVNKTVDKTESLNIGNANFKDSNGEIYLLSPETDFLF